MSAIPKETEPQANLASLLSKNADSILTCVHCGLCLPACPTYRELGNENDSPRGRIYLMRGVVESRLGVRDAFVSHIDRCLGCRACETVCPSGVPYGQLLEAARVEVAARKRARGSVGELAIRVLLERVFTRPRLVGMAFAVARWVRDSGLLRLAFESELFGGRLRFATALLLASAPAELRKKRPGTPSVNAAASRPDPALRVAFLKGCVMEGLFERVNRATERVIEANGCELAEVKGQACCGALHIHAGYEETARALARRNIEAFLASGCDRIVVNAAGCGAAMKEYGSWLSGDPLFAARAREFSDKVRDLSELLVETGIARPTGEILRTVAYDAPCHLLHAQRIIDAPLAMLREVPGLLVIPLRGSENCCGGAGIYNLQHPDLSLRILRRKLDEIAESGADSVATSNPGCIMQIGAGVLLNRLNVAVVHPVELLEAALSDS